ncbi:hypothetical protein KFK09_021165 [Dendrobium nobile]|uniref:Uncharacterized protein n=1 Tax=Dendrobium nobile TaxID=94219 RepID=A0A8T3AP13_DENNO|nr:hypothetical protein KFK09_021165 [Dendrobium nobile]
MHGGGHSQARLGQIGGITGGVSTGSQLDCNRCRDDFLIVKLRPMRRLFGVGSGFRLG